MNVLSLFKNQSDLVNIATGTTVFQEGTDGDAMYVVIEGGVVLSVHGRDVETIGPGGLFGEMALIDDKPRSATARAITATKLAVVDQHRFTFLVQQTPFFALHVMQVLADRLRAMDDKMI